MMATGNSDVDLLEFTSLSTDCCPTLVPGPNNGLFHPNSWQGDVGLVCKTPQTFGPNLDHSITRSRPRNITTSHDLNPRYHELDCVTGTSPMQCPWPAGQSNTVTDDPHGAHNNIVCCDIGSEFTDNHHVPFHEQGCKFRVTEMPTVEGRLSPPAEESHSPDMSRDRKRLRPTCYHPSPPERSREFTGTNDNDKKVFKADTGVMHIDLDQPNNLVELCEQFSSIEMVTHDGKVLHNEDGKYAIVTGVNQTCKEHSTNSVIDAIRTKIGDANVRKEVEADLTKYREDMTCIWSDAYQQDVEGDTPLHIAIINKNTELVKSLIRRAESYSDISLFNKMSQTPLHLAVLTQQPDVVRTLVTSGALVTARDRDGNTPLHLACREGDSTIVSNLMNPVRYPEVKHNTFDIPFQMIPQNLTLVNYYGHTCLHLAVLGGHSGVVEQLIDAGIDVNMRERKTGRTILHLACLNGDLALVKRLVNIRSCNVNARSYDGLTPFDLARCWSRDNICMTLAGAGARFGDEAIESD